MTENWSSIKFKDIVDDFKRGPFGSTIKKSFFVSEGHKVYEQQNAIYDDHTRGRYYINESKFKEMEDFAVFPGDYIVSCSGTIGKISRLPPTAAKGIINQALLRIRLNERLVEGRWFLYLFRSLLFQKRILKETRGSAMKNIAGVKELKEVCLELPALSEQKQIVSFIEEYFSDLDNAIENLKKAQEQLKVYRQAILWKGFEGGFTNGAKGWKTCRITDVCTLIDGDRGKNYPKKHELLEAGYCLFLSAKNVRPNGFEFKENIFISKEKHEKLRSGTLQKGDIVITTRGTLGNVALYDESAPFPVVRLNSGMLIFRLKTDELLNKYLAAFLRSPLFVWQIRKRKSGTAQPQLPANVLEEFEIKIPPVDVQNRIIQETDSRLSICDQAELTIEENLKKAQSLRQSILKQAFEGKLTEQWRKEHKDLISGENSAEALLKRIKVEKEALQAKSKGKKKHD